VAGDCAFDPRRAHLLTCDQLSVAIADGQVLRPLLGAAVEHRGQVAVDGGPGQFEALVQEPHLTVASDEAGRLDLAPVGSFMVTQAAAFFGAPVFLLLVGEVTV
jgi:hypothetical protein